MNKLGSAAKPWAAILIALCLIALSVPNHGGTANATSAATYTGVPNVILDTDMVTSVQDVGALAIANTFSNQGQAKLVGVVVDTSSLYTAGCVDAVDTYYGNPVPIGITYPTTTDHSASPDFIYPCATTFPTTFGYSQTAPPPPALQVYRQTLAAQPDGSVIIVEIGFEGRLSELLNSPPDSFSPLSGQALIAQKVKMLVVMGGGYPTYPPSGGLAEHNFRQDPASAINVANHWPTKVVYSGYELGQDIGTGQNLCHTAPATSPVLKTYTIYTHNVPCNYYYSWDLTAVYHAVLGSADAVMSEVGPGSNLIASDGSNAWITTSNRNQYYLTAPSHPQVATTLNNLLAYNPSTTPNTMTPTGTATPTKTPSNSPTTTSTPTANAAPSSTLTTSPTATSTPTASATPSSSSTSSPTATSTPNYTGVPHVIVDTDMVTDVDDVGALAVVNTLANQGQAKLVGVVVNAEVNSTASIYTVGCVDAIDTYYGNNVPIGATLPITTDHSALPDYIYPCSNNFPKIFNYSQTSPPPSALQVYRQTLAAQPDGSVIIVAIGFEGRLSELLNSPPDNFSPLSGHDLIAKKVKMVVATGGGYPSYPAPGGLSEHNFRGDPNAAINVANNWPTKVVYSGYELGQDIGTGQNLCHTAPSTSPVLASYTIYTHNVPCNYDYSWDLTTAYHAILGSADAVMSEVGPGSNLIASDGSNAWITTSNRNQYYLTAPSHPQVATTLNNVLAYNPPTTSNTMTPTGTATPTSTPSNSPTTTSTSTASTTATASSTLTASPTATSTPTTSATTSRTPSNSPTATNTPTKSPTATSTPATSGIPNVILDTDMVTSVQDVGALAIANTFSNQGQAKLVGVVVDTSSIYTAGCEDAVDTYYGNPVPIGITYPTTTSHSALPDFIYPCATNFPNTFNYPNSSPPPPALQVYRQTLAAQPDGSVIIVEIGFEGRLSELLNSSPDSYSPLSGHDLIARKVKMLVVMGGGYPSYPPNGTLPEHNFRQDPASAINVTNNWPTKVVYSGYELGQDIGTGQNLCHTSPSTSPVLATYTIYTHNVPCNYYYSWDLTAVYHAVLGSADAVMSEVGPGSNLIASDGSNAWITTSNRNQYYLTAPSHPQVATALNNLLAYNPPATSKTALAYHPPSGHSSLAPAATATVTPLPSNTPTAIDTAAAPTSTQSSSPTAFATATSTDQPVPPTGTPVPLSATTTPANPPLLPTSTPAPPTATTTPAAISSAGSLVGSAILPPSRVNLTTEGTTGWARWGLTAPASFDHKTGVASLIPTFSQINGGTLGQSTLPAIFSWSDGTPDAVSTGTSTAVSLKGNGQGFGLTLPADLTARTVHLYVAVSSGQANLTASLSDGSAPPYSDSSMASFFGNRIQEYTLTYHAASPGQSLQIAFTLLNNYGAGTISLAAATLS